MLQDLKGRRTLVTGGAGFIGSHVVRALLDAGATVRVLDNYSTGYPENLPIRKPGLERGEGDLRNAVACRQACDGIETVFHLAAYVSAPGSVRDPITADSINIGGTMNLLNAARDCGVRRVVFSSSAAVYGDTTTLPVKETASPQPLSPYGLAKLWGEHMGRMWQDLHNVEFVALRYFNVYGPHQNPESQYAAVVPRFITTLLNGAQPTIYGDGSQTRDFIFVDDIARANLLAAVAPDAAGKVINVAGGRAISVLDLLGSIASALNKLAHPQFCPARPGDILHSYADARLAKKALGFRAAVSLDKGIAKTVAWYRSHAR